MAKNIGDEYNFPFEWWKTISTRGREARRDNHVMDLQNQILTKNGRDENGLSEMNEG
jgi:hypothetical protein